MAARTRYRIILMNSERCKLEELIRKQTLPQRIAKRARIILMANGDGATNQEIAARLGIYKAEVTTWTKRWIDCALEPLEDRLADLPRSGRPDTITAEQWCQILALACEPPEQHGRAISHWSSRELAEEIVKQGIVGNLSPGHLRKVLKKNAATSPHPLLVECENR